MTSKLIASKLPCPSPDCTSSDGYHEYDDGHGFCYSCNRPFFKGTIRDESAYTYEYLPFRGLNKSTLAHYDVKTKIDGEGKPIEIGFRYSNGSYKIRNFDRKEFYSKKGPNDAEIGKAGLFGQDKFQAGSHKYVTITEGEVDALSLYQVLRSPVVSVQSAGTAARDVSVGRSWLNSYERIYLAFDGDEPGREAARAVAKLFDYNKVYVLNFTKRKDANEYLVAGEDDDLRNLWWNSKKYLPEIITNSYYDFEKILSEPVKHGVPYPFKKLTEMTYGIRTSESVLITAQEGVGKTELMHAIEYKLLKETDDAIGAIFLEEPKRRHLQALAGLELQRPVHLPDSGCTEAETMEALRKAVGPDERLHLYSHFGSDDPEVLLDNIRFLRSARACRFILLDHISMAVSGLGGEDERRALDYLSTRLEMMVKELDIALIFVSHVNDFGQTRGSRYIGKVCDIRIDITRDVTNADPIIRNTTNLMVSKNRYAGRTGPAGSIIFDPNTYSYYENLEEPANDNIPAVQDIARMVA